MSSPNAGRVVHQHRRDVRGPVPQPRVHDVAKVARLVPVAGPDRDQKQLVVAGRPMEREAVEGGEEEQKQGRIVVQAHAPVDERALDAASDIDSSGSK